VYRSEINQYSGRTGQHRRASLTTAETDTNSLTVTDTLIDLLLVEDLHGVKTLGCFVLDEHYSSERTSAKCSYSVELIQSGIVLQSSSSSSSLVCCSEKRSLVVVYKHTVSSYVQTPVLYSTVVSPLQSLNCTASCLPASRIIFFIHC